MQPFHLVRISQARPFLDVLAQLGAPVEQLALEAGLAVSALREEDLYKRPGVAETIDWAHALTQLDVVALTPDIINHSLGSLLKYQDDIARLQGSEAARLLAEIQAAA